MSMETSWRIVNKVEKGNYVHVKEYCSTDIGGEYHVSQDGEINGLSEPKMRKVGLLRNKITICMQYQ